MHINKFTILSLILMPSLVLADSEEEKGIPLDHKPNHVLIPNEKLSSQAAAAVKFNVEQKIDMKEVSLHRCDELPLNFKNCTLSICYDDAPFGKIYRKIIKKEEDSCKYIERTKDFGGMDCLFPNKYQAEIEYLLDKHFSSLYKSDINFTEEEIAGLKETYNKYCKVVPDYSFSRVVTIDDKKYGVDQLAEFSELNTVIPVKMKEKEQVRKTELPNPQSKGVDEEAKSNNVFNSIMLPQEQVNAIIEAVLTFKAKQEAMNNQAAEKNEPEQQGTDTADNKAAPPILSFYLNSIIYLSKENWVVWLNNYKFGRKTSTPTVSVESVTQDHAKFKWITEDLDKTLPNWQSKLVKKGSDKYESKDGNIRINKAGDKAMAISFTLKPNQTFILNELAIVEGKVE